MPRRRNVQLAEQAGQVLIAGLGGASLSAEERTWLERIRPGGVILFRRNIESAVQVASLLSEAGHLSTTPLFRCIDLEGGLVDRLRDLVYPMPSPAAVFATGKRNLYRQHGWLIAREARALGCNTVFAPVLDLALPESASVLRTRAVSAEPGRDAATATVSRYWVTNVLRRQIRFRGIILSDDMEMGGILSRMSIEEAAVQALLAGIQMIEICRDPALIQRAYEAILKEAERSRAFREVVASAWRKIYRSKKRWLHPSRRQNLSDTRIQRLCEDVKQFADLVGETPATSAPDPEQWKGLA
jgi:beta-glucosidase-like glycosyl hydrolase